MCPAEFKHVEPQGVGQRFAALILMVLRLQVNSHFSNVYHSSIWQVRAEKVELTMLVPWHNESMSHKQFPGAARALYESGLCIIALVCAISIARYDSDPFGSPPVYVSPEEPNKTYEHIYRIAAREAGIPVGPLQVHIVHCSLWKGSQMQST